MTASPPDMPAEKRAPVQGGPTPGPWVAQKGTTTGREVIAPNAPKSKRTIARCGGPDREDNARLIAAAPDLLEAADEALNVLIGCVRSAGGSDDDAAMARAKRLLRAALAKAEGR